MTATLTINIDINDANDIAQFAEEHNMSVSKIGRLIFHDFLGSENPNRIFEVSK